MHLIPTVIEKTNQREYAYDIYSRLLEDRISLNFHFSGTVPPYRSSDPQRKFILDASYLLLTRTRGNQSDLKRFSGIFQIFGISLFHLIPERNGYFPHQLLYTPKNTESLSVYRTYGYETERNCDAARIRGAGLFLPCLYQSYGNISFLLSEKRSR